jgi:repressor LexA
MRDPKSPPSTREIQAALGSDALVSANYLIALSDRNASCRDWTSISIAGTICAGFGDSADQVDLGSIPVDLAALKVKLTSRTFALKVRGDSMTGAHIADGDLVVLEAREPMVGEIVAAVIDGETTLKRFVGKDGELFLKAENPSYPDLIPLRELTIQGVLCAVVRVCNGRAL